jgi:flagellar hook-associated protein 3 FlgL
MDGALTLRFSAQAQLDIRRMTRELSDLQRQVASGAKANDLRGLGSEASQVLNAQTLRANSDARASTLNQLEARFGVQASALSQAAEANANLATTIRDAISSNDGRGIHVDLNMAFVSSIGALNETWNGQPMFAGERLGGRPIRINSLEELETAITPEQLFDEGARHQTVDLGGGNPIALADKASALGTEMFNIMRDLRALVEAQGGTIGTPIDAATTDQLLQIAGQLEGVANDFTNAEGRAGQLQSRFSAERIRLQERSNLLLKEIGERADADLAQVSVRISSLMVQYEAAAKTFADLSKLTLLDYL